MAERSGLSYRRFEPAPPGGGRTAILLHGFCSNGDNDWVTPGTARALTEAGHLVLVPDLRGHGSSPAPASAAEAHADAQAADVLAVLDAAGAEEFDIVGYSLGARIAWEVVRQAPGRVGRVVLGGLSPAEPFTAVDVEALHRAVSGGGEPADPFTAMMAGMIASQGERAPGLAVVVEGLRETPFDPATWGGRTPPVLIAGRDDMMSQGIERIVELTASTEHLVVPGGHIEALTGPDFRDNVVKVLQR
ncbi:alpha/beta fold hydrolase [Spongiactinospora sp. TRM90649]|uniref:alpha/beta fold hydrolase n=1 Tax=Spongiactinospora sp. TRM90649 TaxID=3031114 RepID=UPI0023F61D42|nr:alpha/beta fold hydrolase [Spongiactinospora sp. TRM90649]MDF5758967.1 alpha/beta fold hydrolase [Spongiactinospora sp. TRM90649]